MHPRQRVLPALLAACAALFLFPEIVRAADRVFDVDGIIRGKLDDGRLVIEHQDIPGFMPAMTMAFNVADPAETARLQVGDRVRFKFRVGEGSSAAEKFSVTGHVAPAESKPTPARKPRVREGDAVPAFELTDEKGRNFTQDALRGHLTVITFIFTRCPVPEFCPAIAAKFGELQRALKADPSLSANVRLLGITLDPEFDRPDVLAAYAKSVGADPEIWSFATGDKTQTDALARAFAVHTERNGATLDHTLCTALIGPDGRAIEFWRGNGWKPDEVLTTLRNQTGGPEHAAGTP